MVKKEKIKEETKEIEKNYEKYKCLKTLSLVHMTTPLKSGEKRKNKKFE
jgi:hypothetical protein